MAHGMSDIRAGEADVLQRPVVQFLQHLGGLGDFAVAPEGTPSPRHRRTDGVNGARYNIRAIRLSLVRAADLGDL